jgi:hypothetical protein
MKTAEEMLADLRMEQYADMAQAIIAAAPLARPEAHPTYLTGGIRPMRMIEKEFGRIRRSARCYRRGCVPLCWPIGMGVDLLATVRALGLCE